MSQKQNNMRQRQGVSGQRPGIAHRPPVTGRPMPSVAAPAAAARPSAPVHTRAPEGLHARNGQAIPNAPDQAEEYTGEGYGEGEDGDTVEDAEGSEQGEGEEGDESYALTGYEAAAAYQGAEHTQAWTEGGEAVEEYSAESYLAGNLCPMPSGKWLRLRPVSLLGMLDAGQIPNHLISAARTMLYGENKAQQVAKQAQARAHAAQGAQAAQNMSEQERKTTMQLMRHMAISLIASFPVSALPQHQCDPGEVSVYSIWDSDLLAIVNYATQGQEALSSFRS